MAQKARALHYTRLEKFAKDKHSSLFGRLLANLIDVHSQLGAALDVGDFQLAGQAVSLLVCDLKNHQNGMFQ